MPQPSGSSVVNSARHSVSTGYTSNHGKLQQELAKYVRKTSSPVVGKLSHFEEEVTVKVMMGVVKNGNTKITSIGVRFRIDGRFQRFAHSDGYRTA